MSTMRAVINIYLDDNERMNHYEALDVANRGKKRLHRISMFSFDPTNPLRTITVYAKRVYENGSGETQSRPVYGVSEENMERIHTLIGYAVRDLKEALG